MAYRISMRAIVFFGVSASAAAFDAEVISDLVTSSNDESRALDIKSQQFWQPMLDSAEDAKMASAYTHLSVYDDVERAIRALPAENKHVHGLLLGALARLKRADERVFKQAVESSEVANEQLMAGPGDGGSFSSFMKGGQNYFTLAIRRFVGFGRFSERLGQQIRQRQSDVTPVLRGAASASSNVLADCREGSKLAFDVLKYDIYTKGAVKTPEAAKSAANKLIDAVAETRHNFMRGITGMASGIARDSEETESDPSATVTKSLVQGLDTSSASASTEVIFNF